MATTNPPIQISPLTTPTLLPRIFDITASALGTQSSDGAWTAMNPAWETPNGRARGIQRLTTQWHSTTRDRNGDPNTIFLAATVLQKDPSTGEAVPVIVGAAIWIQASMVPGHGDPPATDLGEVMDLEALYPGDPAEQRYVRQVERSLHRRRGEVVKEVATSMPLAPSVMALDLCVVDPAFQRRGVATRLVEWGLEEARRRGGLEAVLEASRMGRHVYSRLGFVQEGGEIEYTVDEEFRGRDRPSNVFMRTGRVGV
ncbi:hypothetical protein BJX76DRAFT_363873 [Aspergillus varians]